MNDTFSGEITKKLQLKTPFVKGKSVQEWFWRLRICHPQLVLHKPEPTAMIRLSALNLIVVSNYFQEVGQVVAVLGMKVRPQNI